MPARDTSSNVFMTALGLAASMNADTVFSVENGLEAKAGGFGISLGKKTGFSTPIGEIKVDTED